MQSLLVDNVCIYLLEDIRRVDLNAITSEYVDYVEQGLKEFGVNEYNRYPNPFVAFIQFVTDNPPLKDTCSFGKCKPGWNQKYKDGFRFGKQLE